MLILGGLFQKLNCISRSSIIQRILLIKPFKSLLRYAKYSRLSAPSCNSVVNYHLKNGKLDEARAIFDKIITPDVYLCTRILAGYVENRRFDEALELFDEMPVKDVVIWNLMMKGCFDCGELEVGLTLFDEMPERNVISWTTSMNGLLKVGRVEEAERLFLRMPVRDVAAWNAMIYGYFVNGKVDDAMKLFNMMPSRNVISWTCMITGLDQHGRSDEARSMFAKMLVFGVVPTPSTFSSVITACANVSDLYLGVQVHGYIIKLGCLVDAYVAASLVTFYANCKKMDDSLNIFNEKLHMNVAVWTSLLTGYGMNSMHEEALNVMGSMYRNGILPNQSSFTSALNCCSEMESVDQGKEIHGAVVKLGLDTDSFVGNSLVVLYSKCGNLKDGIVTFKEISVKNIVSWNTIIVGCAQHGCGKWALTFFGQMVRARVCPDDITFTGLLSACSHSGMLQKGRHFFDYLQQHETMEVKLEHFACMLDVFCRCGELEEAEDLIRNMSMRPNLSMWLSLLNGCRKDCNLDLAERVAKDVFSLDPDCSSAYVLLSNMYAYAGRWKDVARTRVQMRKRRMIKQPGCSWVTQKGVRHIFVSGDKSHPLSSKIYQKLEWLGEKLKECGHVPDRRFALHDVEDEQKESILSCHSERLAICFALINSEERAAITVMKNLRVCEDCHSAIKVIATIIKREIILRDSTRFHHFRDGLCSCGDYW